VRRGRARLQLQYIESLEARLWSGFAEPAVLELQRIQSDPDSSEAARWSAGFAEGRWHAGRNDWQAATGPLSRGPPAVVGERQRLRHTLLAIETAIRTHRLADAHLQLDKAAARWPDDTNLDLLSMNLIHAVRPPGHGQGASDAGIERLEWLNRGFVRAGLRPLELHEPRAGLYLDNLAPGADGHPGGMPVAVDYGRVSILVAAFNRERTLPYAIRSLTDQTYRDIEIIIVDDGSTDATLTTARALANEDPRITVIAHPENRGLFAARNTALAVATGDYVTQHDSDDWSHPQRIALQIAPFGEANAPPATLSRLCRVTEDFRVSLRPFRPMLEPINRNFTSLMMPRWRLLEMGGWDPVCAHADKELIERLRQCFGEHAIPEVCPSVALSFFADSDDCITGAARTHVESLHGGAWQEYEEQAEWWRAESRHGAAWAAVRPRSSGRDPFFVPNPLLPEQWRRDGDYDLVLVSDLSLIGGTRSCNLAYIDACTAIGMRVGIANYPHFPLRKKLCVGADYRPLLQRPNVDLLTAEDEARCRILVVHHPPILQWRFTGLPRIEAQANRLLMNQLPFATRSRTGRVYSVHTVDERFRGLFGTAPVWTPISASSRRMLHEEEAGVAVHASDWTPPLQRAFGQYAPRTSWRGDPPVIGRHSRDHWMKWPATKAAMKAAYCADTGYPVRILGGCTRGPLRPRDIPRNWNVSGFDAVGVEGFPAIDRCLCAFPARGLHRGVRPQHHGGDGDRCPLHPAPPIPGELRRRGDLRPGERSRSDRPPADGGQGPLRRNEPARTGLRTAHIRPRPGRGTDAPGLAGCGGVNGVRPRSDAPFPLRRRVR
jgi:glycosyltransferase involved in cell wall biosynthesis